MPSIPAPPGRRGDAVLPHPEYANLEVFNQYDMVVSISQKTINDQLKKLVAQGAIKANFIIVQQTDAKGDFTYEHLDAGAPIPKDSAYINASLLPQIDIPATGTAVTFVLQFTAGSAAFWVGAGPLAQLQTYDVAGWSYGVSVTLDLKAVTADALGRSVSPSIRAQLTDFTNRMFDVSNLFLDFDNADLLRFDPATTKLGATDDAGRKQLALFMQFYLRDVVKDGNPFILGYSVTETDRTQLPDDIKNVPDLLRPVGTTFTLYREPSDPNFSSLNFVLVTKGGHKTISGTPPNFVANWLLPSRCDAKVIYSDTCLVEPMLVQPLFQQMRQDIYSKISSNISVGEGNDYAAARAPIGNDVTGWAGWSFNISNVGGGDDQYVNQFSVQPVTMPNGTQLAFSGKLHVYKEVSKNCLFCTARAWASGDVVWRGTITLLAINDSLTVTPAFATVTNNHDDGKNSCASALSWIGTILGSILDVFTGFSDGSYFGKLISNAFSVNVPGIGNVSLGLQALGSSARGAIVLPAGGVFDMRNPNIDGKGNLSLEMSYRS